LDKYIEADLDDEGTVASDVETDGKSDFRRSELSPDHKSDLPPRPIARKSTGRLEEEESPDVGAYLFFPDGILRFLRYRARKPSLCDVS
jgi:hypothetical protein